MNVATPKLAALFEAMAPDLNGMCESIALGLALGQMKALVADLRAFGDAQAQEAVTLTGGSGGGLSLSPNGTVSPVFDPSGPGLTYDQIRARSPQLMDRLVTACQMRETVAFAALKPLFDHTSLPTRQAFESVARWAPLIAKPAYRMATRSISMLDTLRDDALRATPGPTDPKPTALSIYYGVLLTSAHLILLASPPGGQPWMADMARTFTWVNWTPSFSLLRERTLWLAAASIRAAAAFGPGVIDPYVEKLSRGGHPVSLCDALAGLVAVACSYERSFDVISKQIDEAHDAALYREDPYLPLTLSAFHSAKEALRLKASGLGTPPSLERLSGWTAGAQSGFATPEAFRLDPLDTSDTGEMVGFLAIPTVLHAPLANHYPARIRSPARLLPVGHEQVEILHNAWSPRRGSLH